MAGSVPDSAPTFAARIRAETLDSPDGGRANLLVLSAGGSALCLAVILDPAGPRLLSAMAVTDAEVVDAEAGALLAILDPVPLTAATARDLGLFFGGLAHMAQDIVQALDILREPDSFQGMGKPGIPDFLRARDHYFRLREEPARTPANVLSAGCLSPDRTPFPADAPRAPSTDGVLALAMPDNARLHPSPPQIARIKAHLGPWYAALDALVRPEGHPCRDYPTWTQEAYAHYAAPGETGRRRRQAAELHPLFVAALALDPDLVAPVDAGRPFEPALLALCREAIGAAIVPGEAGSFDLPRLRRMRGLTAPSRLGEAFFVQRLVTALSLVPLSHVPDTPAAWENFLATGFDVVASMHFGHLDPVAAFRGLPRDWDLARVAKPFTIAANPGRLDPLMTGLGDMVSRAAENLGPAVLGPLATPERSVDVAEAALLEGRTLAAAWELQAAWHEGVDAFTAYLDFGPGISWEPVCAPFTAPNGVTLRCLATPRELIEEGGQGPDSEGVPGLHHCVGGYVRRCVEAKSHILSASVVRGGRRVRLSTIEIKPDPYPRMVVHQHLGHRNGPPPGESVAALDAFLEAVREGRHAFALPRPFASMAAMAREPSDPGRVFDAWRPYMTPRAAAEGLPGLRARFGNES